MIQRKAHSYHGSQGAVLIVSLILLLIMTLIGVAAIDSSSLQSQMSTNSLKARTLYQASLSEIQAQYKKMIGLVYLESIKNSDTPILESEHIGVTTTGPGLVIAEGATITQGGGGNFTQSANLVFSGENNAPLSGYDLNTFGVYSYEINVTTTITNTSTVSNQTQGLQRAVPIGQD